MLKFLVLLPLLAACGGDPAAPPAVWLAPLAGQTGVPTDLPLVVHTGSLRIPPDYALPDLIRVVDLETGGFVAGRVDVLDDTVHFVPTAGWRAARDYAWTFDPARGVPHGPELDIPDFGGNAPIFSTSSRVDLLAASLDEEGRVCVITSRPLTGDDEGVLRFTADEVEVDTLWVELIPQVEPSTELEDGDPGVSVLCATLSTELGAGAELAIRWGELGAWRLTLLDLPLTTALQDLRGGAL
ncbi:MAG: hypothetical protein JXX28_13960 [Deltaproteobacteria bacterium]|nr:hypothetical protein [Deltaproteobacteria bacterium]